MARQMRSQSTPGHTRSTSVPAMRQSSWHLLKTMCELAARAPCAPASANSSVAAKYRVEITQTAEGDVDETWTHIAVDSQPKTSLCYNRPSCADSHPTRIVVHAENAERIQIAKT